MKLKRFRMAALVRIALLSLSLFLFSLLLQNTEYFMAKIMFGILVAYQIYGLIHLVDKTNRDLQRFFESILHGDFTETFSDTNINDSFSDLRKLFNEVIQRFLTLRSEKEKQDRHLQTVVKHVGVGLISFKESGEIMLINTAAKQLLSIDTAKSIESIHQLGKNLVDTFTSLKPGLPTSLKIETISRGRHLSLDTAQFKQNEEFYTLISIKDIQTEIERENLLKELEIAGNVQKSLLPLANPDIPFFDIAGKCCPAHEVGGDYYDFIEVEENKLALIIGDVSGKGTSAAFYMTLLKGYIQSNFKSTDSPREVLIRVNELLSGTVSKKLFVTLFIALLNWKTGEVVLTRAGHMPGVFCKGDTGDTELIKPAGIALGLRRSPFFEEVVVESRLILKTDDWLILYTDGFTDAVNGEGESFGEKRLLALISENKNKGCCEMVESLVETVQGFTLSAPKYDDMTVVAIKGVAPK